MYQVWHSEYATEIDWGSIIEEVNLSSQQREPGAQQSGHSYEASMKKDK